MAYRRANDGYAERAWPSISQWRRPCIICRRQRPAVFIKRLPPFGVVGLCDPCRRAVLEALLEECDPHTLSEVFAVLRLEDAERREKSDRTDRTDRTEGTVT